MNNKLFKDQRIDCNLFNILSREENSAYILSHFGLGTILYAARQIEELFLISA